MAFGQDLRNADGLLGLQMIDPLTEPAVAGEVEEGGTGSAAMTAAHYAPYEILEHTFGLEENEDEIPELLISLPAKRQGPPPPNARFVLRDFERTLTAEAHLRAKWRVVAQELKERNQDVLGALFFSCEKRGPVINFLGSRSQKNASTFTKQFWGRRVGRVLAAGGIGPLVTYVDDDGAETQKRREGGRRATGTGIVLRNGQSESCALQRNSTVFVLMVTSARSTASSPFAHHPEY